MGQEIEDNLCKERHIYVLLVLLLSCRVGDKKQGYGDNTRNVETIIAAMKAKSGALKSPICAINGMPDHIHVAVKISVMISVSEWVKQVKGISSYTVNHQYSGRPIPFR